MKFTIEKYQPDQKKSWNEFIATAKNATFQFNRGFMDYHSDRFEDFSLLIYDETKIAAAFPANKIGNELHSHQRLSYGGLIVQSKMKFQKVVELLEALLKYLENIEITKVHWKQIPEIYTLSPNGEFQYLMNMLHACLKYRNLFSVIDLTAKFSIASNRMEGVKRASKHQLKIEETSDFSTFWKDILIPNLKNRHDVSPVHSLAEIELLKERFPENIRQFNVIKEGTLVAGTTIFETMNVAHVQYISANEDRSELGSLDFLFDHLIKNVFNHKRYFDFGTSNENEGQNVNKGLLYWKEGFGARSLTQDFYTIETKNHIHLNGLFV